MFVKPTGKFFSNSHDDIGHFFRDHNNFGGVLVKAGRWMIRSGGVPQNVPCFSGPQRLIKHSLNLESGFEIMIKLVSNH